MSPQIWLGAILLLVVQVMTACGGGRALTVDVTEKEWTIKSVNPTIKAGWVKFVVKNEGTEARNLAIQGTSIEGGSVQYPARQVQGIRAWHLSQKWWGSIANSNRNGP